MIEKVAQAIDREWCKWQADSFHGATHYSNVLRDNMARAAIAATEVERLRAALKEAQGYVCMMIGVYENYGRAQILNDEINSILRP